MNAKLILSLVQIIQSLSEEERTLLEQKLSQTTTYPQSEWRKHFPRDFARNAEHYMYGAPREDEEE